MLQNLHYYLGTDVVIIGNGSTRATTHVHDTYINNGTIRIKLCDVLLIPVPTKNLLSIM